MNKFTKLKEDFFKGLKQRTIQRDKELARFFKIYKDYSNEIQSQLFHENLKKALSDAKIELYLIAGLLKKLPADDSFKVAMLKHIDKRIKEIDSK